MFKFWDKKLQKKCDYTHDFEALSVELIQLDTMTMPYNALGAIQFQQSNTKRQIEVSSLKPIDVLGEFGGFLEVFILVFGAFGSYYSQEQLKIAIAKDNYKKKNK